MIETYLRTFITKILFFIFIKPPFFSRLEVDTQQLKFPNINYTIKIFGKQANIIKYINKF